MQFYLCLCSLQDYKRALQLTINEQRRKSRLKLRLQSQEKELKTMLKKARNLVTICHELHEEAHDIDLDFVEKTRLLAETSDLMEPLVKKGKLDAEPKPSKFI